MESTRYFFAKFDSKIIKYGNLFLFLFLPTILLSLLLISCGDSNHNNTFKESEQNSNTALTSNSENDNKDVNYTIFKSFYDHIKTCYIWNPGNNLHLIY